MPSLSLKRRETSTVYQIIKSIVALDRGQGRRVDSRRVTVDYERGRTKKDWLPKRLGGGIGSSRRNRDEEKFIKELIKTEPVLKSKSNYSSTINKGRSRSQEKVKGVTKEGKKGDNGSSHHRKSEREKQNSEKELPK